MEYLGKIDGVPSGIKKQINSARRFFEPISFNFDDEGFNSFYFKTNKIMNESGRAIVEDFDKSKYIVEIEQINYSHQDLSADVFICGWKKLK